MTQGQLLSTVAAKQRVLLANKHHTTTRGTPLDFKRFHFLQEVYADTSTDIVLTFGVQSGKTEWMVCDAFALLSLGVSYQLVQPKQEMSTQFRRTRVDEPLERSEFYGKHIKAVGTLYKWRATSGLTGILRVTFSNCEDEMISFPADVVGVDERDRCNLANLALLPDRLQGSPFKLTRETSTPTTKGNEMVPNIWYQYCKTDQREFYVACPHCGEEQTVDWFKNIVHENRNKQSGKLEDYTLRDEGWHKDLDRDIYAMCHQCDSPLDRLARGKWHPTSKIPKGRWRRGYHANKLLSPLASIREMWGDYQEAAQNPTLLQRFYNSMLGLPFAGSGTQITEEMLYACRGTYILHPAMDTCPLKCSMGVDVSPESLDVRISSYPSGHFRRRTEYLGKVRTFDDLLGLMQRFSVSCCVIDAEPETREALRLQRRARCPVYVCYTREKMGVTIKDLELSKVKQEKKFTIDRTLMMDTVLASYAAGQVELPMNIHSLSDGMYTTEMTNPTRVLEVDSKGKERFTWTSGKDHSFLADVYDYCAMILGGMNRGLRMTTANPRFNQARAASTVNYDVAADMA